MNRTLRMLAAACFLLATAAAQQVVWQKVGKLGEEALSTQLAFVGDVDSDGYEDVACLAETRPPPSYDPVSNIYLLSGRDGRTLRAVYWPRDATSWYFYREVTRAGDVDGDGYADYAASRYDNRSLQPLAVEVRSGRDDRVLWTVYGPRGTGFGWPILGDVDLDGDRRPDLLVGAYNPPTGPSVTGYDHAGRFLYRLPYAVGCLGRIGDLDGDGCEDFVAGTGWDSRGSVDVVSGRTGRTLVTGYGELYGDSLGTGMVTGCGDVDGDGALDFAGSSSGGFSIPGVVRVFSGKTGTALFGWRTAQDSGWGRSLAAGDLDLDGIADLLVGCTPYQIDNTPENRLTWFSLRDGRLVAKVWPPHPQYGPAGFGFTADIGKPQPGSEHPTLVASEAWYVSNSYRGRLTLFRMLPPGATAFGKPCAGTLEAPPRIGVRDHDGKGMRVHLSRAPAGVPVALLAGLARTSWGTLPLPLALDAFGFPGCSLLTSVEVFLPAMTGSTGKERGFSYVDVPLPLADSRRVLTLHGQWLVPRPTGGGLSAALSWGH